MFIKYCLIKMMGSPNIFATLIINRGKLLIMIGIIFKYSIVNTYLCIYGLE